MVDCCCMGIGSHVYRNVLAVRSFRSILSLKWLCSSLQSLSSTVSSIESLGAPSTLKLPLWDKASAEFCFAKSRELLTKPSAWTSYMDVEFDARLLDNAAMKQNLVKSTEFLENGNARKNSVNCKSLADMDAQMKPTKNGKVSFGVSSNFDFPREPKRVSTSYVDRYFDQPKYFDDEVSAECATSEKSSSYFDDEKIEKFEKINNFEQSGRSTFWSNFQDRSPTVSERIGGALGHAKLGNNENAAKEKSIEVQPDESTNLDTAKDKTTSFESPRNKPTMFDSASEKLSNFDLGTRPKIPGALVDPAKFGIAELTKKFDLQKARGGKVPFVPRNPSQEGKTGYNVTEGMKTNLKAASGADSPRGNIEAVRINIQSFRKVETIKNGHDNFPFVISNNPLFIAEPEKKESPIYSSSESLRVNFQRLRRKSDAETNNQVELSSKIFAEKYQREVSGLESVKNYLDSKKGQGFNLGLGKLTQNMIQLGKNIAQNSRNLESSVAANSLGANIKNLDAAPTISTPLRSLNVPLQKPNHLDLNIPLQPKPQKNMKLNLTQRPNAPLSPSVHQHILEPPKLYQNENARMELTKPEIITEKLQATANVYRHRTSSLSENRKPPLKNVRRSFHPGNNESSEDSDSVSHSETDIRTRLRYKRRHKKVPHSLRLNLKNKAQFLHPDTARGFSAVELCGKSPPPSTSFLNSLSPPFSSRNNILSWPESAPSSSLTFTSNSELDSDTSSEYPEFTNDILTFPPSPAP